jgi:hypothetical protein
LFTLIETVIRRIEDVADLDDPKPKFFLEISDAIQSITLGTAIQDIRDNLLLALTLQFMESKHDFVKVCSQ